MITHLREFYDANLEITNKKQKSTSPTLATTVISSESIHFNIRHTNTRIQSKNTYSRSASILVQRKRKVVKFH